MQPRINVALKAARAAVDFILHVQEKILFDKEQGQNPEQAYKDICIGAEKTIVHTLAKAYPTETITTRLQGEVQTGEKGEWIIDAIQGQHLFSRNLSGHALTISYVENGKVEHALLINSSTRDEFYASKGRGAYLNNSRIRTSSIGSIENSTLGSQFPGTDKLSSQITSQFNALKEVAEKGARVMMQDCPALMLANVAAGKLDAVWAMKLYDWETQAPLFIAKEAGCLFSDFQGSPSVNDTVLCANPRLFKSLLPVLNKHF
ncbi:inositol monophosphatase [Marinomonas sp. SBI22]|uniref:inositol monophosphatase family protein n=1 Tax=unclassified Marinomonas TaxID=196814 RepID=UPI0007AF5B8C|nr:MULTISPECIES: inositol monophosphatase family protein [unclassified Marinomonas]KZM39962.1 inositol monophosphatase [Marinomonas sp. SBI22]KZM41256.1 inositol monophosphatase [Marinomonas sp. SBI8L]